MKTLGEHLPRLLEEVASLLQQEGEAELAKQLPTLPLVDRCRCGDDFCATIYTAVEADREQGLSRTVALHPETGYLILDLRDQKIVCIQVLYRPEIRETVLKLLP